jgi:hypothetical protein
VYAVRSDNRPNQRLKLTGGATLLPPRQVSVGVRR